MKNRFDARSNIDHISGPLLLAQYLNQDSKLLAPLLHTGRKWFVDHLGRFQPRPATKNIEIKCNIWSIKVWTTHNLSLWFYEYFWMILLYGHLVFFILKVLAWEICNMKRGFTKKVIIKSQWQFIVYVWFEFLWIRH